MSIFIKKKIFIKDQMSKLFQSLKMFQFFVGMER